MVGILSGLGRNRKLVSIASGLGRIGLKLFLGQMELIKTSSGASETGSNFSDSDLNVPTHSTTSYRL